MEINCVKPERRSYLRNLPVIFSQITPEDISKRKSECEGSDDQPVPQLKIYPSQTHRPHAPISQKKLSNAFLSASKWGDIIVGRDVSSLIDLVSLPSDEEPLLKVLLKEVEGWLNTTFSFTDDLDATFLNLVNSTTEPDFLMSRHLANRSFRKPLNDEYLSRCATLWGRFLCMVVRSIDCTHSTISFDDEQIHATLALLEALKVGRGITAAIYQLSYRMAMHSIDKDRSRSPFYQFLVTVHLQSDGHFNHPHSISLNILMLQLCIRATVIERGQYLINLHHFETLVEAYHEVLFYYLTDGTGYIFGLLLEQFRIVAPFSYSRAPLSLVKWNASDNALVVRGSELTINSTMRMIDSLFRHSEDLLFKVLQGFDLSEFDSIVQESFDSTDPTKWPKDDLSCTDFGYSFLTSAENPFGHHLNTLWSDVFDNPVAFERFYVRAKSGRLQPRFASIYKWLDTLAELTELVFTLSHLLSVPPPKASELETYRATNTLIAPRTLYSIMGHGAFITRSTDAFTGRVRIVPHFMPYRLTRLVTYLVGPIRVLEQELLEIIPTPPPKSDNFAFIRRGIPLSRIDFTQVLRDITAQYTNIEIGLLDYPRIIQAMLSRTVNIDLDMEDDEGGPIDSAFRNSPPSIWKAMEHASDEMFGDCLRLAMRWWHYLQVENNPSPNDAVIKLSDALAKITVPNQERLGFKQHQGFPATPDSLTTIRYIAPLNKRVKLNLSSSDPPSSPLQHLHSGVQVDSFIARRQVSSSSESS